MSTPQYIAEAQAVTTAVIQKQVTRCNESLVSTGRMRTTLARSLGVTKSQASLLVNYIVGQLCEKGILEFWDSVGRGDVYKINLEKLAQGSSL